MLKTTGDSVDMAKNQSRKNKPSDQAAKKKAAAQAANQAAAAAKPKTGKIKDEDILYQVKTKKDSGMLKAFITFTYRVLHPRVSARLVFYGIIVLLPGIFYFKDVFWKVFFIAIGAALILLGFFRQYLSLAITKKNDPDYKSGAEFTYNFSNTDGEFLKNGEVFAGLGKYKNIAGFYHDDDYLYMSLASKELIIIPKNAFTVGDSDAFEEFIYKKSKKTCHWLPDNFRDQWKKRRAERAAAADKMSQR